MLVRDAGDSWQIVLQTDHGRLAGDFARAWAERPEHSSSMELVADRHDDGWFIWEQAPNLDREGRPCGYLDVRVTSHIAFFRAMIEAVTEQDPYAGLIASMHGAGIYRNRYGLQDSLRMSLAGDVRELVELFVQGEEKSHPVRMAELGVSEEERWRAYKLLQVWDQLSLYASLNDLESGDPDSPALTYVSIPAAPLNGEELTMTLRPDGPLRTIVDPYPFGSEPVKFALPRRRIAKRDWRDPDEFREDFYAAEVERLTFEMAPAVRRSVRTRPSRVLPQ
jgi:hypothetical protein